MDVVLQFKSGKTVIGPLVRVGAGRWSVNGIRFWTVHVSEVHEDINDRKIVLGIK